MKTDAASDAVVETENAVIDPDFIEPAPARLPSQLWQPWTLILPALLIIPLLCLAFAGQVSPTSDEVLLQKRPQAMVPASPPERLQIFVPRDDEKLHPSASYFLHPIPNSVEAAQARPATPDEQFSADSSVLLATLFEGAPNYFPKGAEVQDVKLEQPESGNAIAHVSLNETFWNWPQWGQMDTGTILATEAIAHTVRSAYRSAGLGEEVQVLLLRDGHAVSLLGEMDMADPITPDDSLVAAP